MNLALTEMRRAKLRFGLLTSAVALLVFLIVFLSSLSGALLRSFTGALESLPADGLGYSEGSRSNVQASRLDASTVADVAAVPGVQAVGALSVLATTAVIAGTPEQLQVVGVQPGTPSEPTGLREGRLPQSDDEVAVDATSVEVRLGDTVAVRGSDVPLTVTGRLVGTQFGADTAWMTASGYDALVRALNPGLVEVPVNAVTFRVAPGQDPQQVAQRIGEQLPGVQALTRDDAVAAIPGAESVGQTFGLLVAITFVIGVVVVGFFFLILTVQKLRVFTLLRATGASTGRLAGTVVMQIVAVVLAASAAATVLAWGALTGLSTGLPVRIDPVSTAGVVAAVLVASLGAGLLSVRRIAQIQPATAAGAR